MDHVLEEELKSIGRRLAHLRAYLAWVVERPEDAWGSTMTPWRRKVIGGMAKLDQAEAALASMLEPSADREYFAAELQAWIQVFGAENAAAWMMEGISFGQACLRHAALTRNANSPE